MWQPVDAQFHAPRLPVSVVAVWGGDAEPIRAVLEALNCVVLMHKIGTPSDFLKTIAQGEAAARYVVIDGHGLPEGLLFGEYGLPDIDTSMLRNKCMPPEAIREHVCLPGSTVISTFCWGGSEPMARAFLAGKVAAYMGCREGPNAVAMLVFLVNFFFSVLGKKLSDRDAWHRAVEVTDHGDIRAVSYFHGDGTEERF